MTLRYVLCFILAAVMGVALSVPPTEWQAAINRADMLYTENDVEVIYYARSVCSLFQTIKNSYLTNHFLVNKKKVDANNMPMIGNGLVALQIGNENMYISGVFNGHINVSSSSHRAVIPTGLAAIAVKPPG